MSPVSIELDWTSVDVTRKPAEFHEYSHMSADRAPEGTIEPEVGQFELPGKSPCVGQVGLPEGSVVAVAGAVVVVVGGVAGVVSVDEAIVVGT